MKEIWVYIETFNKKVKKVSLELLTKANELSQKLGAKVVAVYIDKHDLDDTISKYGADKIIHLYSKDLQIYNSQIYTDALYNLIKDNRPHILLIGATSIGRDLAPRLAAKLNTGLTADCTQLDLDEDGLLLQTRPAFGGNIMATIICPEHIPQMATVRPGIFEAKKLEKIPEIEKIEFELEKDCITKTLEIMEKNSLLKYITESNVIVAGGRGLSKKEGFDLLRDLAKELNGTIAASRAAVEAGWAPQEIQVGQTGKTVKPKIYIACGISGAIQHIAGMKDSKCIIAINKDKNAPIFKIADYAIIGDVYEIVPKLIEKLRTLKQ
ncbi:electron transfer flavoprotein alpha subunit [Thermosipho japonicus]|uniref:Electron transfer flavoprotein alpha subunit n=1 Tax=Thermosipho japonicus TaxID=90323 RepID=A0A841GSN8_9BACT|nr:electron transfer flavoprotein subunit alpha/FixB family protein [Thermosipho japonicus]MBB6062668.1 electron transfer flavoprotein alpha subunit [Thermosipho japonicus]